ncbi:MAG: hypothetical protein J5706_02960, partial [Elusimicrobiales bacterium]|nr:hypothetical protein [Elusimicrobiales bacterium]
MTGNLISIIMLVSWPIMIFLSGFFLFNFFRKESKTQLIFLAAIAAIILYASFTAPVRGGYDNNHDFASISLKMDWSPAMYSYKEIAPIMVKQLIDKSSGYKLSAILTANRLIPVLSMLILYAALRISKAGKTGSLAGTALLFLNFHTFLNASSLGTASLAAFVFISAMASLLNLAAKEKITEKDLIWIFSSAIIAAMTRIEHLPALCILGTTAFYLKLKENNDVFRNQKCIFIFFAGTACVAICALFQFSFAPQKLLQKSSMISNFNMQMIAENFSIIFSQNPAKAFPSNLQPLSIYSLFLFLLLAMGLFPDGLNLWNKNLKKFHPLPCALAAIFI